LAQQPFPILSSLDALIASDWHEEHGHQKEAEELRQPPPPFWQEGVEHRYARDDAAGFTRGTRSWARCFVYESTQSVTRTSTDWGWGFSYSRSRSRQDDELEEYFVSTEFTDAIAAFDNQEHT
jgi:hypothetical protein